MIDPRSWRSGLFLLLAALPTAAHALDCKKAGSKVDKAICASPAARKADEAMSKAYFDALASMSDKSFRDALIASQRRWLKARADQDLASYDNPQESGVADILRQQSIARQGDLPMMAARLKRQRELRDLYPGRLAGFAADCFIAPPPYGYSTYSCMPVVALQKGDRLCRAETSWASGHQTEVWTVARVGHDSATLLATCKEGYASGPDCPSKEISSADAGWTRTPGIDTPDMSELSKDLKPLDPDLDPALDDRTRACLSEAEFPPVTDFVDPAKQKP